MALRAYLYLRPAPIPVAFDFRPVLSSDPVMLLGSSVRTSAERARQRLVNAKRQRPDPEDGLDCEARRRKNDKLASKANPKQRERDLRRKRERLDRRLQDQSTMHRAEVPATLLPASSSGFSGPRNGLETVRTLRAKTQEEMKSLLQTLTPAPFQ